MLNDPGCAPAYHRGDGVTGQPSAIGTGRPAASDSRAVRHIATDHRPSRPVQATGVPFLTGLKGDSLNNLVAYTRFGQLWQLRMFLWLGMVIFMDFRRDEFHRIFLWTALVLGVGAMLVNSLFSHASAARRFAS